MGDTLAVLQTALADRYRLERAVGQGGMGVVYLAHDLKHDRAVAIKVLRPEVAALLGRERFLREIGIAAQLSHPHIVPLYDSGEAAGHLYYVMPHVPGPTLRERLDRDGPLPPDEALGITRQVATALAHAHGRGVIHRDIKPSNILLNEGFALVADFGLARALSGVLSDDPAISSVGLPIGTPRYMSPEQAIGAPDIDGRSDLFSLGCVLREMLQGATDRTPLPGTPTPPPARAAAARPEIPAAIQPILARCLALDPVNRYATAQELLGALGTPVPSVKRRAWAIAGAVAITGLVAWTVITVVRPGGPGGGSTGLDTTRYVVLPFERLAGAPAIDVDVPIRSALGRWSGISVVGGLEVSEALKNAGTGTLDRSTASGIARRLGAGRYVRGQIVPFGDSVQVEATVYDSRTSTALVEKHIRLPSGLAGADAGVSGLVDSLLFQGAIPAEHFPAPAGTASVPAMRAFIDGRNAVDRWDLPAADSAFGRAVALDQAFARAQLWLAQVRVWQGQPAVTWRAFASQAAAAPARLGARDTMLAGLLVAMSRSDFGMACPRWLRMTREWPAEFPVWYGAASCLGRDQAVVRDPRSPTGWKFRSSYEQVQRAWRQAFSLLPTIYRDFRGGGSRSSQWLLWTGSNRARMGSAIAPDTGFFASYPTWQGDTLAFIPRRLAEMTLARTAGPGGTREAVTHQRLAFYDLASEWVSSAPRSLEAHEAVALALWSLGNPAAVDSIAVTRARAQSPGDRVRLGVSEVLMRILQGAPDTIQVGLARRIADSVLQISPGTVGVDPWDLATLASLTGRANLAAHLLRLASPRTTWTGPLTLTRDALAYLAFAALGGPSDSVTALENRVTEGIASAMELDAQAAARREWLGRPLALVALDVRLPSFAQLTGSGDYLIDAEAAQTKGDTATARKLLGQAAAARREFQPAELMFEALLPEARIMNAMGNRGAAIELLDPTLRDLRHVSLPMLTDPVGTGLLVRAMAFRADLALAAHDSSAARRWGETVAILWSSADPHLAPVVARMGGAAAGHTN